MRSSRPHGDGLPAGEPIPVPSRAPALLFALAAALYLPTLANGLVNFDDHRYVAGNPFASRGLAGIPAAWTTAYDDAYYPLTHTLYCAIQAIAGPTPLLHHLVQLLLFAAAVALAPAALAAFRVPRSVAVWAALLWAFHPLRVESVSWAANLKDTLSLPLLLGAFALVGAGRRRAAAVTFAAALLAKSMVFPVAGLFVLLEWREGKRFRDAVVRALPFLVPAVAAAALGAALHLGSPDRTVPGGDLLAAIPSVLWLPWWYLGRTLVPLPSLALYNFAPVGWTDLRLFAAALLWAALAVVVARARLGTLRDRLLAVAAWWLPFAAVTGLVPLVHPVADRYALLPSLPITVLGVWAAGRALGARPRLVPVGVATFAGAALVLGGLSIARQREWKDSVALWEAERDRDGSSVPARLGLVGAYGEQRRWAEVTREAEAIARLDPAPGTPEARALEEGLRQATAGFRLLLDVAGSALKEGQPAAALPVLEVAIRLDDSAPVRALAAQAAQTLGQSEAALAHADRALELDPSREDAVITRALALVALGRYDEALAATGRTLTDPNQRALLAAARALVLQKTGRQAEARALLESLRGRLPSPPAAAR